VSVSVATGRPVPDARWLALPAALLAAALGAAAVVSPAIAVVGVVGIVFVAVAFHDLAAGVALFAAFTFVAQMPGVPGSLGVKVAGLVLLLAALRRSGTPFLLKEQPTLSYALAFLAAWAFASTLWAVDAGVAAGDAFRLALNVALVFIVFAAVRTVRHARWLIWGYIGGAVVAALFGLVVPGFEVEGRVGGTLGPNLLAAMLVPALVFSLFAFGWTQHVALRWLLGVCGVLFTVAIFLTESRGGLVSLAVALVAAVLFGGSFRSRALGLAAVVASVGLVYFAVFASSESWQRVANPGGGTGRTDLWSVATGVIEDHPIVGVGAGNFPVVARNYASETINLPYAHLIVDRPKVTHNTYLGVLTDLGAVGLAAYVAVIGSALVLLVSATRAFATARESELELMSRALFIGLVAMLTHFVFLSGQHEKQFWLLIGFAVALYALARRRELDDRALNDRARPPSFR
jgi:O-antigen ligase